MKRLLLLVLLLPLFALSQQYNDLDSSTKAKVDSIVRRMEMIRQMKTHNKMVSFCEWSIDGLKDFWSYLIYDLNYKTDAKDNTVNIAKSPTGFTARLWKMSDGYQQTKQALKVAFTCKPDGTKITEVRITGPVNLLIELYLKYWEGAVRPDFTKSGAIEKTYLPGIETIWLYPDKILIKPFKSFSDY